MKIRIDFETRSAVNLKECGLYVYAEDPSTDVFCCAVKVEDQKPMIWVGPNFRRITKGLNHGLTEINDKEFIALFTNATEIRAFNAQFERVIYREILNKRYGFPELPYEVWHCTAAKAAYFSLPPSLAGVCEALKLSQNKDAAGSKIMLKMTNPDKTGVFHETPADFVALLKYCVQDVEAECGIDEALYDLPIDELKMYHLDQRINDRGIYIDREAVSNLIWKVEEKQRRLLLKVHEITNGEIKSTKQLEKTKAWLAKQGVNLENLKRETVKQALKNDMPFVVTELLGTRQALAKSSVAKLDAIKRWACADSRVRGSLQYYGANTGRWAGRGIQPQNLQRDSFEEKEIEQILEMGVLDLDEKYGCTMQAVSKCMRGMLGAAPDKKILCADFASIEARVLAWIAGEEKKIKAFEAGLDVYVLNAVDIYRIPAASITKDMRLIGKVCELALGYQGWLGAFQSMAQVYGAQINVDKEIAHEKLKKARELSAEEIKAVRETKESEIIQAWRASNSKIVALWAGVQSAALAAVKTGKVYSYGSIQFGIRKRFLHCRLPSGRLLSYCDPATEIIKTKYGVEKEVVTFTGWDAEIKKWCKQYTYGGKLTENIVQATARDLLRDALFRLEDLGFNTVLHIHDEVLSEENQSGNLKNFIETISQVPTWATGCPIAAEGWEGKRYKK